MFQNHLFPERSLDNCLSLRRSHIAPPEWMGVIISKLEKNTKPRSHMLPMKQYDGIDLVRTVEVNIAP